MIACIIQHNMIIKDEKDLNMEFFYDNIGSFSSLLGTQIRLMHFLRPTSRLRTRPHTPNSVLISFSTSGNCMGSRLPFYSFDVTGIHVLLEPFFPFQAICYCFLYSNLKICCNRWLFYCMMININKFDLYCCCMKIMLFKLMNFPKNAKN